MKRLLLLFGMIACWASLNAQKANIAPTATITATGASATLPPSALNDLDFGVCGTQQMWLSTATPPSPVIGVDWIQWEWTLPQSFDEITIHHGSSTTRFLTGGLIQYWDGSQWVSHYTFSNLPMQCISNLSFQRITTTKFRITQFQMTGIGQLSNPNFREFEIFQASTSPNDAGVSFADSVQASCSGSNPVMVKVQNFGTNRIDSVTVNWSVDGVLQPSVMYNTQLDTIGGTGNSSAMVILGNHTFMPGITYNLKSWTSNPNSNPDTTNFNDTLNKVISLGAPAGLSVTNIGSFTADVTWSAVATTNYEIIYGTAGFNPATGGTSIAPAIHPQSLSGLSGSTTYDVYLLVDCGGGVFSDTAGPYSFTTLCAPITTYPHFQDFELATTGAPGTFPFCWVNTPTTGLRWQVESGATSSSNTGPDEDHTTGTGKYIYLEASSTGLDAFVQMPELDLTSLTVPSLEFWYHMFGSQMGTLEVQASLDTGQTWTTIVAIVGEQQTSSADAWRSINIDISAYKSAFTLLRFRGIRGTGFESDMAVDDVTIAEAPPCPAPYFMQVSNIASDSATLSWTSSGTVFNLNWGPPGFTQGDPSSTFFYGAGNPYNVTGLSANTTYDVYVQNDCSGSANGVSSWSGPFTFTTLCNPFMAPYLNDFDTDPANVIPDCWTDLITPGRTTAGVIETYTFTNPYSAPNHVRMYNGNAVATDTTLLISPEFSDLPAADKRILFFAQSSTAGTELIVGTMSDPFDALSFTPMDTIALTATHQIYTTHFETTTGYNGTDTYIAFMHGNTTTFSTIFIDNFHYQEIPACLPPLISTLGTGGVTSVTADVFWGSAGAGAKTYIEWGGVGFIPGTGMQLGVDSVVGSIDSYTILGLSPQTSYEFYIQDSCLSDGLSPWVGPFAFTTACSPVTAPYLETFDGTSWITGTSSGGNDGIDPCWGRNSETGYKWSVFNGTTASANTGPDADFSGTGNFLYTESSSTLPTEAELYTPLIDVSALNVPYVNFYYHRFGTLANMGDMKVEVNDGNGWVTMLTLTGTDQTSGSDPWKDRGIDVSSFGDTIQVRFVALVQSCCSGDMAIDHFEVKEAPSCPDLTGLNISQVLDTTATFGWNSSGSATTYQIWYGPQGFYQGTTTLGGTKGMSSTNSLILDTLSANTCYEILVRAICAPGDTSGWSGPISFCTPCSPVVAPYIENFDNIATSLVGDFTNCWSGIPDNTSSFSWRSNSGTTGSSGTGPNGDATTGSGIYLYTEASSGALGNVAELYSPIVNISALTNPELRFSYHMFGSDIDTLHVDIYDGSIWQESLLYIQGTQQTANSDPWRDTILNLSTFSGLIQVRFRVARGNGFAGDVSIDDVEISNPISCPDPSNFMVSSVVGSSATLTWSSVGNAQSYIIQYGPGGFAPGSGTVVTTTGTSYTINGLPTNNVAYQAYIRAYCGVGDSSFWTGPIDILTDPILCTDDFEAYNTGLIQGQSTLFLGWAGVGGVGEVSSTQAASGTKSLHIYGDADIVADMDTSFTSGIHNVKFNMYIPANFGGYYNILHNYTGPTNVWAIEVYLDMNGTATVNAGTNGTGVIGTYTINIGAWNQIEHIIDLDNDTAWIRVNGLNTTVGWQFSFGSTNMGDRFNAVDFYAAANAGQIPDYYIDDFCVEPYVPVSCVAPSGLNVSTTNIGCDSAEVSWNSVSTNNNSILQYGPTGFTPGTTAGTVVPFVSSPYVITGLTPGTTYDFYVADTCATDTSQVAGPLTFTTGTGPVAHASYVYSSTYTATTQIITFDASGSSNAVSYSWDFGNGNTGSGVNPPAQTYNLPNTAVNVVLTVTNACGGTDDTTVVLQTNIGLEEPEFGASLALYPNPSPGIFMLEFDKPRGDMTIEVINVSGQRVYTQDLNRSESKFKGPIDLSDFADGIYMLRIQSTEGIVVRRLNKM